MRELKSPINFFKIITKGTNLKRSCALGLFAGVLVCRSHERADDLTKIVLPP